MNAKAATPTPVTISAPDFWEDACKHLMKKDRVMKRLIPQFKDSSLQTRGDAFVTLARSIVGQQISVKAAQTVWDRFAVLPKKMTPRNVLKLKVDDMRAAGLSARKVEYLVDLSLNFDNNSLTLQRWDAMEDEDIIAQLVALIDHGPQPPRHRLPGHAVGIAQPGGEKALDACYPVHFPDRGAACLDRHAVFANVAVGADGYIELGPVRAGDDVLGPVVINRRARQFGQPDQRRGQRGVAPPIGSVHQSIGVGDIDLSAGQGHAERRIEVLGEHRAGFGHPVAVGVA